MLFLLPAERGKGIGRKLVQYGILNYGIREVTVNEQNPQAVGFYKHLGFETYKKTERDEEEKGLTTTGWIRNIYPTRKTAEDALERNDLFVMVLHALAVDPYQKNKGYGKAFVAFYENYAKQHNCVALRMDTNIRNTKARNLYKKLGHEETGSINCIFNGIPDVQLVCLEKYLG